MLTWTQNATHPAWTFVWWTQDEQGNRKRKDLTGASSFALTLHPTSGGSDIIGGGSFSVINATQGVLQYQAITNDVATPGSYQLFVTATFSGAADTTQAYYFTISSL